MSHVFSVAGRERVGQPKGEATSTLSPRVSEALLSLQRFTEGDIRLYI